MLLIILLSCLTLLLSLVSESADSPTSISPIMILNMKVGSSLPGTLKSSV